MHCTYQAAPDIEADFMSFKTPVVVKDESVVKQKEKPQEPNCSTPVQYHRGLNQKSIRKGFTSPMNSTTPEPATSFLPRGTNTSNTSVKRLGTPSQLFGAKRQKKYLIKEISFLYINN